MPNNGWGIPDWGPEWNLGPPSYNNSPYTNWWGRGSGGGGGSSSGGYGAESSWAPNWDERWRENLRAQSDAARLAWDRESGTQQLGQGQQRINNEMAQFLQRMGLDTQRLGLDTRAQGFTEEMGRLGFGENQRQFNANLGQRQNEFGQTFGEGQRQFNENLGQRRTEFGQTFGEGQRQFNVGMGQRESEFGRTLGENRAQSLRNLAQTLLGQQNAWEMQQSQMPTAGQTQGAIAGLEGPGGAMSYYRSLMNNGMYSEPELYAQAAEASGAAAEGLRSSRQAMADRATGLGGAMPWLTGGGRGGFRNTIAAASAGSQARRAGETQNRLSRLTGAQGLAPLQQQVAAWRMTPTRTGAGYGGTGYLGDILRQLGYKG